jgi:hypothetical protein
MKFQISILNTFINFSIIGTIVFVLVSADRTAAQTTSVDRTPAQAASASANAASGQGRIVIVGYKPKPGKTDALMALMKTHMARLRALGLVTSRESIIMTAKDGTVIEVFEWKSKEAIDTAHMIPAVQVMWKEYADACDFVPVANIDEAKQLFSDFSPVTFGGKDH